LEGAPAGAPLHSWKLGALAAAALMAAALTSAPITVGGAWPVVAAWPGDGASSALRRAVATAEAPEPVAAFYRAHRYRPLWLAHGRLRPEADLVVALIANADADGLDPSAYAPEALRVALAAAQRGGSAALARADLALSTAYAAYVSDLHRPPRDAQMRFWDPALPSAQLTPRGVLEAALAAPDLASAVADATRMHPIYEQLRAELVTRRAARGANDPLEPAILANMARARALPADPGPRYILVDAAARRLWLYENGQAVDSMRVIVGTPRDPTPVMAGLMRHARFRPYWNLPVDLVRREIAPHVLREGPDYLDREDLEILSDWTPAARRVDPAEVDWNAVAAGDVLLRMRRLPGGQNILGQVKLMLPNPLGIYLHDTPNKAPFLTTHRTLSHGCIRLEDAHRLTRRLFGPIADNPPAGDDARVDLEQPVPVYIVYFTLASSPGGLERRPDIYHRDPPLIAELGAGAAPT
jgi:murein L,D-transpeptidase YcbB/YkuD